MERYNQVIYLSKKIIEEMKSIDFGYSQKIIHVEDGDDQKIHFKILIGPSRTSLISDYERIISDYIDESNKLTGFNVDFEKDVVLDFYKIGNWDKKGKYENHVLTYIEF